MNLKQEIEDLTNKMVQLNIDGEFTERDLVNCLLIIKPILMSIVAKNPKHLGKTKEERFTNFSKLIIELKLVLEKIVGFKIDISKIDRRYEELESEVIV